MDEVGSYEEIASLRKKYFKIGAFTNNFLREDDYKFLIDLKKLYYCNTDNGLFLFKKRDNDYLCYYDLIDLNDELLKDKLRQIDDTMVLEIAYKNSLPECTCFFESIGFAKVLERIRFKRTAEDCFIDKCEYDIKLADSSFSKMIKKFLLSNFDIYTGCIPSDEEILVDIRKENFLIAINENDVIGVLHFSLKNGKAEIRHLAVKEEFRNKKIASSLINKYHELANGNKSYLWVAKNNELAQSFYRKHGYEEDSFSSIVMIRKD